MWLILLILYIQYLLLYLLVLAPIDIYEPLATVMDRIGCWAEILSTNWQMSCDTPVADIHSLLLIPHSLHTLISKSTVGRWSLSRLS